MLTLQNKQILYIHQFSDENSDQTSLLFKNVNVTNKNNAITQA